MFGQKTEVSTLVDSLHAFNPNNMPRNLFVNSVSAGMEEGDQLTLVNSRSEAVYNSQPADFGYEVDITTLTYIRQRAVEQKFYEVAPAEYIGVEVGNGAFSDQILTWKSYQVGGDFFKGMIKSGGTNSRLERTDVALEKITFATGFWAEELDYSIIEVQQASRTGNWSLIEQKEETRKKRWDLGIQYLAFLGHPTDDQFVGLLNLTAYGVNSNTTLITKYLSSMDADEFTTFLAGLIAAYRANNNKTQWPDTFIIPEADYVGLATPYSADFPNVSKFDWLSKAFKQLTKNQNAEIIPLVYSEEDYNDLSLTRYVLYNRSDDTLKMDIPINYTSTLVGTANNFTWQGVGYGQFTGVQIFRPLNVLYFDF